MVSTAGRAYLASSTEADPRPGPVKLGACQGGKSQAAAAGQLDKSSHHLLSLYRARVMRSGIGSVSEHTAKLLFLTIS